MDYAPLFSLPTGTNDIESVFKTARGSTYAQHADSTTTRNRSGEQHKDTSTGIQPRSGRTIYMNGSDVNKLGGIFQNPDIATQLVPVLDANGKPTGKLQLQLLENDGPRKAGSILGESAYYSRPQVGLTPVEIYNSVSRIGDDGRGVHFGTSITEVKPVKTSKLSGKAGIAAALASGAGAASAGDLRRAAGDVAESFLPLGLTPSELAPGTLTPEQLAARDAAYAQKRAQDAQAKMKAQALLRSGVAMPDEYRVGGRVKLI